MLCAVYRSKKKPGMFLYVPKQEQFDDIPEALMEQFGKPELVMVVALDKRKTLAGVAVNNVREAMEEKGFYLQLPPKEDNLLEAHRVEQGLPKRPETK
ncbi:YcgL domain-containing protein [Alteromonas sp. ASW11-19]|uniref:YcgL domain-containing protein OCL06_15400 n=1 Tax=Alteromonas salexigens TaxID=2982530 RepID=A0ABT2VS70_9ALTE|nr:YcgL domain-containing protein [Alteromonas salexigens]MCU7555975.1 YcgL domain-containing protein [Alteromonas salexigens]